MRRRQAGRRLGGDAHDLGHLQGARGDALLQGAAGDVLQDEVGQPLELGDGVDGDDMVVEDGGGDLGLAQEALACRGEAGQLRGQHLDGHDALQGGVDRLEHHAHAPAADDGQHLVGPQPAHVLRLLGGVEEIGGQVAGGVVALRVGGARVLGGAGHGLPQDRLGLGRSRA